MSASSPLRTDFELRTFGTISPALGHGGLLLLEGERVVVWSSFAMAPGSRFTALLLGPALLRCTALSSGAQEQAGPVEFSIKSHGSKRQDGGHFVVEGRTISLTREVRVQLDALLAELVPGDVTESGRNGAQ